MFLSGKVKVRFVTNQDFDGEDENDVNKVMRSLPEDTNQLVSNYLKDVFVSLLEVVFILPKCLFVVT